MIDQSTLLNSFQAINNVARADYAYYDARIALLRDEKEDLLRALESIAINNLTDMPNTREWVVSLCIRMGSNDKFKELVS